MHNDRTQIVERLADLAYALDTREWAAVGGFFTEAGMAYGDTGRENIVAGIRAHLGGCGPSQHLLGNYRVELDGDQAESRTYVRVYHQGAGDYATLSFECFGQYTDQWVRSAEGWQIHSRVFDVTFTLGDRRTLQPD